ncbi:hypothetical protein [Pantoea stewartii]|uniref:hypothetical protein n=1 Tax=Pantoea stewartii TaxID=66269 RepID=UPI003629989C
MLYRPAVALSQPAKAEVAMGMLSSGTLCLGITPHAARWNVRTTMSGSIQRKGATARVRRLSAGIAIVPVTRAIAGAEHRQPCALTAVHDRK